MQEKFFISQDDWNRALYLNERVKSCNISQEDRDWQRKKWAEVVGSKDFAKTLDSMGFDHELLIRILEGEVDEGHAEDHEPEWVSWARDAWSLGTRSETQEYFLKRKDMVTLRAAEEIIWGYQVQVEQNVKNLTNQIPGLRDMPRIMASGVPVQELKKAMMQTYVLELNVAREQGALKGSTPKERFESFDQMQSHFNQKSTFWGEYPVLLRTITSILQDWSTVALEFTERFTGDMTMMREIFEIKGINLTDVSFGVGDKHRNGRSVAVVSFDKEKIVYKPKPLQGDVHWNNVLDWVNSRSPELKLLPVRTWNRGDYGWAEHVHASSITSKIDAESYYWRGGVLLGLFHALCATDMHFENLITHSANPVVIDLETFFHQFHWESEMHPEEDLLNNSVMSIGLLPQTVVVESEEGLHSFEPSAFGDDKDRGKYSSSMPRESGTDRMVLAPQSIQVQAPPESGLNLHDEAVSAKDYVDNLVAGFDWVYRTIMSEKQAWAGSDGILNAFSTVRMRHVAAPTFLYMNILGTACHPDYLRDALDQERLFAGMHKLGTESPERNELIRHEIADLRKSNVPYFGSVPAKKGVLTSDDFWIDDFFSESGLSRSKKRVMGFSEEDLRRQVLILRASFAAVSLQPSLKSRKRRRVGRDVETSGQSPAQAALNIARRLMGSSVRGNDRIGWLAMQPLVDDRSRYASPGIEFSAGSSGIGLFFSALSARTRDSEVEEVANSVSSSVLLGTDNFQKNNQLVAPGVFSGLGSLVYYLSHAGGWTRSMDRRGTLWDAAEDLLPALRERIDKDLANDIVEGNSGAILALLSLDSVRPESQAISIARMAAERLMDNAIWHNDKCSWKWGGGDNQLAGFSHGASGIAYALSRLHEVSPDNRIPDYVKGALAFEQGLFDAKVGNWKDLREGSSVKKTGLGMLAWCHGAPGIGLARIGMMRAAPNMGIQQSELLADMIKAEKVTIEHTIDTDGQLLDRNESHVICHGTAGNLEFIAAAERLLSRPGGSVASNGILANLMEKGEGFSWNTGMFEEEFTPGLLAGVSGIGYNLLKISDFENVPSVLLLETPKVV